MMEPPEMEQENVESPFHRHGENTTPTLASPKKPADIKRSPAIRSSPRRMGRTPLSRKSSEPSKRKTVGASAALEGVKKSIARKRRSLLEISSAVTSGLMHASQPYEDYVPAEVPDYIPFEPPPDFYAASPCATQKALDSEVKQIAPHATALIGEVAARMRQNVCEASAKGKLAVVTAATRLKENVLDGVEEVKASVRDASKIQWKSEIKKEVFMLQSSASTATTDSLIDGSTVAIGQVARRVRHSVGIYTPRRSKKLDPHGSGVEWEVEGEATSSHNHEEMLLSDPSTGAATENGGNIYLSLVTPMLNSVAGATAESLHAMGESFDAVENVVEAQLASIESSVNAVSSKAAEASAEVAGVMAQAYLNATSTVGSHLSVAAASITEAGTKVGAAGPNVVGVVEEAVYNGYDVIQSAVGIGVNTLGSGFVAVEDAMQAQVDGLHTQVEAVEEMLDEGIEKIESAISGAVLDFKSSMVGMHEGSDANGMPTDNS